jgi:hypothetical protein
VASRGGPAFRSAVEAVFMRRHRWAILGSTLLLLTGCDRQPPANTEPGPMAPTPSAKLPEITAETEEGFVDLVFRVQKHESLADGSQSIRAAGLHKGREVGFEVVLGPTWKQRQLGKDIRVETGVISYRRLGPESDAFLQVLDELYGAKLSPKLMAADTPFTGMSLQGNPGMLADGPVKMKLFYEKGGEERYAELYTNIDLAARRLEVREKDEGYRRQVVQALQGN